MHLEILREIPEDSALRAGWNALVLKTEQPQVFYTWEWARAVAEAYRGERPPWLAVAAEGDEIVGVAALAIEMQRRAVFLNSTTGDYCDFLSAPDRRGEFVKAVLAELQESGVHDLFLTNLPRDSATVPALGSAAKRLGMHAYGRLAYDCARVVLGSSEERAELKRQLGKKKTFRRAMHALGAKAPLEIRHLTAWEEVEGLLPAFANAHVARFLATNRLSNLVRRERREFLRKLAELLCASQNLALSQMRMGDEVIAWNYGFRFAGSWFWYQPTFESSLEVHSPGRLLLANLLMEVCDNPAIKIFDLGLGAEGYKERVANGSRETLAMTISTSRRRVAQEQVRSRAADLVKRSPKTEAAVRGILSRAGSARQRWRRDGAADFGANLLGRARRAVSGAEEVRFYAWTQQTEIVGSDEAASGSNLKLLPADLRVLADAAMAYEDDTATATYLLRAGQRCMDKSAAGFVLFEGSVPVHFAWTTPFEGFGMAELQTRLSAPEPEAWLIFDCWTPPGVRNRGMYAVAIARVAVKLAAEGRRPWIFSAAMNAWSLRGIERAGFQYRYAMTARSRLFRRTITTELTPPNPHRKR